MSANAKPLTDLLKGRITRYFG